MSASLTRFRIENLHGHRTINVPIVENRIILVGENGTGKSTVANLIYYVLTQQWRRIKDYKFESLEVTLNDEVLTLSHDDIDNLAGYRSGAVFASHVPHFPLRLRRQFAELISRRGLLEELDRSPRGVAEEVSDELGIPTSIAKDLLSELVESRVKLPKHLFATIKILDALQLGQFLYLPTYRRIEQDLKSIFRNVEIEEKVREFRDRFNKRERTTYIELVEFGMEDVEKTLQARMAQLKESVRTGLSNLTGTYLREVIRGIQEVSDIEVLKSIDPKAFQSIFARIDEAILPAGDKKLLQNKIAQIAEGYSFQTEDKVIAHFLSKLVLFFREQEANEVDIREFVKLCNEYLTNKRFVYDNVNYSTFIRQDDLSSDDPESDQLELKMLSSGEKQIVSLFSHIYLSGQRAYFVIIDEPELSLSVPWQQRFLPDIINTGRCTGMIAVTHSPFIWDNDLQQYVRSLAEFVEPAHVIR